MFMGISAGEPTFSTEHIKHPRIYNNKNIYYINTKRKIQRNIVKTCFNQKNLITKKLKYCVENTRVNKLNTPGR